VNGDDASAPTHPEHLKMYPLKIPGRPVLPTKIKVVDQFNPTGLFVNARRPSYLLVPAAKSLTGPTPVPTPGTYATDHFECYAVTVTRGTPKFRAAARRLRRRSVRTMTVDVKRPAYLCNPADKQSEDPTAPSHIDHLMCYKTKQTDAVKFVKIVGVFAEDQFGAEMLDVKQPQLLCVPAWRIRSPRQARATVPRNLGITSVASPRSTVAATSRSISLDPGTTWTKSRPSAASRSKARHDGRAGPAIANQSMNSSSSARACSAVARVWCRMS